MNVYLVIFRYDAVIQWCEGVFSTMEKAEEFLRSKGFTQDDEVEDGYSWVLDEHQDAYIDERQVDL